MVDDRIYDLKYIHKSNWPKASDSKRKADLRRQLLNSSRYQKKDLSYYCEWLKKAFCMSSSVLAVFGLIAVIASSYPTIAKNQLVAHASQKYYELLSKSGVRHYQVKTNYYNVAQWQDFENTWSENYSEVIEEKWEDGNNNYKVIMKDAKTGNLLSMFMEKDNVLYEKMIDNNQNNDEDIKLVANMSTINLHTSKLELNDYKFLDQGYGVVSLDDDIYCLGEKYDWVYNEGNNTEELDALLADFEKRTNLLAPDVLFEKLKNDKNTRYLGKWTFKDNNYKVLEVIWPSTEEGIPTYKEHIYIDQETYQLMVREKWIQDKAGNWHKESIREIINYEVIPAEKALAEFNPEKDGLVSVAEESNELAGLIPDGCFINDKSIPPRDAKRLLDRQNQLWQKYDNDSRK